MTLPLKFTRIALASAAYFACASTSISAWAQTAPPDEPRFPAAQDAAMSDADRQAANLQLIQSWQQQTGQATNGNLSEPVEFHGQTSLNVYSNNASIPSGNSALSSMVPSDFSQFGFQGDLRVKSTNDTVTYLQGSLSSTNDRSVQSRYEAQINNLQAGRTGNGYQFLLGDVVADFSGLSSGLGLRGALASMEFGGFTATGFAGTVAESWEALNQRSALDGLPPRNSYLRDVLGLKGEYKVSGELTAYATVQNYNDKANSAPLPPLSPAFGGNIVSAGVKYNADLLQVTSEFAHSSKHDQIAGSDATDNAFVIDGTYSFSKVKLRTGFHDVGVNFASLSGGSASGVREWYASTDWTITPELSWNLGVRDAITRWVGGTGHAATDTLSNSFTYNVLTVPGLGFGLTDTRIKSKDALGDSSSNDSTQFAATYASSLWSANAGVGLGHSRNPANNVADSNTQQWQVGLGRNWSNASADAPASWTLGVQGTLAAQVQKLIVALTESRSSSIGLNVTYSSDKWGNVNAGLQRQKTSQPTLGAPDLLTTSLNLDWSKEFQGKWTFKTYATYNLRNHGDVLLQADERTVGMQGVFRW